MYLFDLLPDMADFRKEWWQFDIHMDNMSDAKQRTAERKRYKTNSVNLSISSSYL